MLHDPGHIEPPPTAEPIVLSQKEKNILIKLAEQYALRAADPVNARRAKLWQSLNDMKSERPVVWINEIPWHEMNVDQELTLQCEHPFARATEQELRRSIYQWDHMPGDMILSPEFRCPKAIHSTDFGIVEQVDIRKTAEDNDIVSRHFVKQIESMSDLEKISMPVITHNTEATNNRMQIFQELFSQFLPVRAYGQSHIWYTPWDYLIRWWGVQDALMDLVMQPDLVHAFVARMADAWNTEMDQFEQQQLLELDCDNTRIGSGGYGYCSDLPGSHYSAGAVTPKNMWGCSNAQIFSSVSPEMHWEFAIEHDLRWLARYGLTYYGCCEPLDSKIAILKRIPNLRKISFSPWCNSERMIAEAGSNYVLSRKPNPAVLAEDSWRPEQARKDIREILDIAEGKCHIEFIMKDISTVHHEPQRLWEWAQIAAEEVER